MSLKETTFSFDPHGTILTAIQGPPDTGQAASPPGAVHAVVEAQQPPGGPASELGPPFPRQVGTASHHSREIPASCSQETSASPRRNNQEPEELDVSYMSIAGLVACIASYLLTHLLALVILRFV